MATEVVMPQMGFDMREGRLVRWLKREGDAVNRGEAIAEVETDKAIVEVEAFASGVLRRVLVDEGATVPVGTVIGIIAAPNEALPERPPSAPTPPPTAVAPSSTPAAAPREAVPRAEGEPIAASPVARRLAEQEGIDLSQVQGSGPRGRIVREDVERAVAERKTGAPEASAKAPAPPSPRPSAPPAASVPAPASGAGPIPAGLTPMRQAIARRMSQSKREVPHFYVTVEIDMSRAMELRRDLNEELEEASRLTINDLVVKACARALQRHPDFNVSVLPEGIHHHTGVSISLAIALEQGLIAPALVDVDRMGLVEIARASKDLIERARRGHLRPEEYAGGSFAISNMGMYGVTSFSAIIVPPNAAALAVGTVQERPVVREGKVEVAQIMAATLSADHRATDGAQAAQFLGEIKRLLEKPNSLLV